MVVQRSPLRSLQELKEVGRRHLVVHPTEHVPPILRALGFDPKRLKIGEQRRQIVQAVLALRESDHLGCIRVGKELCDVYRIGADSAVCLSLEGFGLNQVLVLVSYHALGAASAEAPGDDVIC